MKAIVYHRYGSPDVLGLRDVETPDVADDGVLVRVHAASANRSDWETLTARPAIVRFGGAGFLKPKHTILGSDLAGRVEAIGRDVTQFQPGDEVFGDILYYGMGAFAEYVCVPEHAPLVPKPASMTFETAATLPQGAVLALQGLRLEGEVGPGDRVLINGAGGGGGTFAVQIAKSLGAEVTAVDHTTKLDVMQSIGADRVIDYTNEDFAKGGRRYDRILDFATHRSMFAYKRALASEGTYVMVGGSVPRLFTTVVLGALISKMGSRQMKLLLARPSREDLSYAAGLVEAGTVTPVIDRRYKLSEVPDALRRLGAGLVAGKAVVTP